MEDARAKAMAPSRFGFDLFVGNIPMSVSEKVTGPDGRSSPKYAQEGNRLPETPFAF